MFFWKTVTIVAVAFFLELVYGSQALAKDGTERGPSAMVTICHKPETPAEKTMMVNLNALQGHLGHSDLEGPCVLIDAHGQFDHEVNGEAVINLLDQGGISRIILSAIRGRPAGDVADLAVDHPDRITPAVRTKGDGYEDEDRIDQWFQTLKARVDSGRFKAMAEILMYHTAKRGGEDPEVIVHPHDDRVQRALGLTLSENWPFIVHIEFAAASKKKLNNQNLADHLMEELEQLLEEHPDHPFVLIHMGQLQSDEVRRLIESHNNIYFMTSQATPVTAEERQPWVNMFDVSGDRLTQEWERLVRDHPDRFILAFDNVYRENWNEPDRYLDQIAFWRKALKWLPINVAEAVAHGNAERLWNLPRVE
ncbi:MAG: amidohydrolase family protein [Deltaproteobacteria bacterium]|nr:amidohydrolase family protein [Deltaproteobacteria bacterium]